MKVFITNIVLVFCFNQVLAQPAQVDHSFEQGGWGQFLTQTRYERPATEIKGDQYLFHDWVVADIDLADDRNYDGKELNLNLLTGDIEVPRGDHHLVLDRTKIRSFTVGDRKFVNINGAEDRNSFFEVLIESAVQRNTFFEILEEGTLNVYCYYYSVVRQPSYGVPGSGTDRIYTAMTRKTYFVQTGPFMEKFRGSKKKNMKHFQSNPQTVEYIEKENIKTNKIKGFVKAARFYNQHLN